uniref:Cation efflux protein transmembrane domain-containing protein n=1 Tax=Glossina austeni TaxID=7395 RepID=A0A1A9UH32_GLOAU
MACYKEYQQQFSLNELILVYRLRDRLINFYKAYNLNNFRQQPEFHFQNKYFVRDYCYGSRVEGVDKRARRKLITASILCLFFMLCMIVGGILSNSLAIATDAAHLLTDLASFLISLFAIWLAGRPSTERTKKDFHKNTSCVSSLRTHKLDKMSIGLK